MDEQQEKLFQRGFNNGYLLAKHEPELAAQLTTNVNSKNAYLDGLAGGKEQYEIEVKQWSKSFSKGTPNRDDRDIQKER